MSLEKLKQQIQDGTLSGVYAFSGAEDYLKRHYIDLMRRKLVPDPEDPLNFVRLYYREATAAQVLDFALGLPVFAEKKAAASGAVGYGRALRGAHRRL